MLWHPQAYSDQTIKMVKEARQVAAALGISLEFATISGPTDFEAAFASLSRLGAEAAF